MLREDAQTALVKIGVPDRARSDMRSDRVVGLRCKARTTTSSPFRS